MKNVEAILTACTSRKLLKKNIEKSKIREDYYEQVNSIFIWWYRPVPAIRTFLTRNDLSGKTIKPYATNAGWLGGTFERQQNKSRFNSYGLRKWSRNHISFLSKGIWL